MVLKQKMKIFFSLKTKTFFKYFVLLDIVILNHIFLNDLIISSFFGLRPKRLINGTINPKYLKINRERV